MTEEKLNRALSFAAEAHKGQHRKMGGAPYILHAMEAAIIVSTVTDDRDVIIAALLHDTVEDTDTTPDEIRAQFGDRVAALVAGETENKRKDLPAEDTWQIRKEESLRELAAADTALRALWLGDKLSNLRSLYRSWLACGDRAFDVFHQKDKSRHAWYYRAIAKELAVFAGTAAYLEYTELICRIFGEGETI